MVPGHTWRYARQLLRNLTAGGPNGFSVMDDTGHMPGPVGGTSRKIWSASCAFGEPQLDCYGDGCDAREEAWPCGRQKCRLEGLCLVWLNLNRSWLIAAGRNRRQARRMGCKARPDKMEESAGCTAMASRLDNLACFVKLVLRLRVQIPLLPLERRRLSVLSHLA